MKKTFQLTSEKKTLDRQLDAIRHEIKKYTARQRKKKLPEGFETWNFDCAIGATPEEKQVIQVQEIKQHIDRLVADAHTSFYLEVVARAAHKPQK
jgi:hypothetical protein